MAVQTTKSEAAPELSFGKDFGRVIVGVFLVILGAILFQVIGAVIVLIAIGIYFYWQDRQKKKSVKKKEKDQHQR